VTASSKSPTKLDLSIVVAPDSFKGSLAAAEVAHALERGLAASLPGARIDTLPLSDGGEGWVDALVAGASGEIRSVRVCGPLGRKVDARFGLVRDRGVTTGVVEMAQASGLGLVPVEERDPTRTTTRGTGQLIAAALDAGASRILIGVGGSATNDGGAGMARALGARLLDRDGNDLPEGGGALAGCASVDVSGLDVRLEEAEILVASDVDNPLLGPRGASAVYGPQKGATARQAEKLDAALATYADAVARATGRDVRAVAGAGAAGGLGFGLMAFLGAELRPGIEIALDALRADELFEQSDLVVTGEGRIDEQTLAGKVPVGVARRARRYGVPVVAVGGSVAPLGDELQQAFEREGVGVVLPSLEDLAEDADPLDPGGTSERLVRTGARIGALLSLGSAFGSSVGKHPGVG
jgi:glycerate kinase